MAENSELSEREFEILSLVAKGKSNKEIAQELFISANTVKVHLRNIFAKIEVSSRTEATLYAVRAGMVEGVAEITPNRGAALPVQNSENSAIVSTLPSTGLSDPPKWWQRPWILAVSVVMLLLLGASINRFVQPSSSSTPETSISLGENRWEVKADLPSPRFGQAAAVYENQIILIGGETGNEVTTSTESYNPETDLWSPLASKPTAVTDIQAAALGGKIYVPGGRTSSGEVTNILEIFDPQENQWIEGEALPIGLSAYALVAFEGKLYLFGGWDGENYSSRVFSFNPDQNNWSEKSPLPSARAFASGIVIANKIFVMGGYDGKKIMDSNLVYLPIQDDGGQSPWEDAAPLPEKRYAMGVAYIADKIYVLSGVQPDATPADQLIFLPELNEWTVQSEAERGTSPTWAHIGIAVIGPKIYALGGILDGEPTNQNVSFQAIYTVPLPVIIKP